MKIIVGIDISKATFDACITGGKAKSFKNTPRGFEQLLEWSKNADLYVMEATGAHHFALADILAEAGKNVSAVNPRQASHYAKALGICHKTDRVDAQVLERYAQRNDLPPYAPDTSSQKLLKNLVRHRERLNTFRLLWDQKCRIMPLMLYLGRAFLMLVVGVASFAGAQAPKLMWSHWEHSGSIQERGLHSDPEGYAYSIGNSDNGSYWRFRFDSKGNRDWQFYVGDGYAIDSEIDVARGRGYVVGEAAGTAFVSCFDLQTGAELWLHTSPPWPQYGCVAVDGLGFIYVYSALNGRGKICKLNPDGGIVWESDTFPVPGELLHYFAFRIADIALVDSGSLVVGSGGYDWWDGIGGATARLSTSTGEIMWNVLHDNYQVRRVLVRGSRCYLIGESQGRASIRSLDLTDGSLRFQRHGNPPQGWQERAWEACFDAGGNLYWTGGCLIEDRDYNIVGYRMVTEALTADGVLLWRKENTNPYGSYGTACMPDPNGGVIVAGGVGRQDSLLTNVVSSYKPSGSLRWQWANVWSGMQRNMFITTKLAPTSNPRHILTCIAQESGGGTTFKARLILPDRAGPR